VANRSKISLLIFASLLELQMLCSQNSDQGTSINLNLVWCYKPW